MSTWKPDSDLMRLNRAPVGEWIDGTAQADRGAAPRARHRPRLGRRLRHRPGRCRDGLGLRPRGGRGRPHPDRTGSAAPAELRRCSRSRTARLRKRAPVTLDLNGIAKGYGVDRLAGDADGVRHHVLPRRHRWRDARLGPPAGRRALDHRGRAARPRAARRHSVLALQDAAVATSGDYRHWVEVKGRRLSHTMDPGAAHRSPLRPPRSRSSREPAPRPMPGRRP